MANVLGELFGDIASAIREKTGEEGKMKPAEFPEKISGISNGGVDVSCVTATAGDVLEGKTIVDASGNNVDGSMPNKGAYNFALYNGYDEMTIPKGYHNGSGKIKASSVSRSITPTKGKQNIAGADIPNYVNIQQNGQTIQIPVYPFLSRVTVNPIPDKYQDVSNVTATAGDVRAGKIFVDAEGNEIAGTLIPNTYPGDESTVFEYKEVGGFAVDAELGAYTPGHVYPAEFVLQNNTNYTVWWDAETYHLTSFAFDFNGYQIIALGNASSLNQQGNGEPFLITYNVTVNTTQIYSTQSDESHFVGIYRVKEFVSTDDVIWADANVSNSLAGSGIIRYVTFMNHDGTVEYGRKSVIQGENCVDPVTGGFLAAPTRESTPQYNYTYAGWATEPNGGLDANALKTVNEDRTVYANFVSVLRYYDITFYDDDGITVLDTKSFAYGTVPSYSPKKQGFVFEGWNPEPVAVTGEAGYQAIWGTVITFAEGTWEDIVRICNAGEAEKYFSLKDTREFSFTDPSGNVVTTTLKIIGFNKDTKSDGSGTAAITIAALPPVFKMTTWTGTAGPYYWSKSNGRTVLNGSVFSSFPEALRNGIKSVTKHTRKYVDGTDVTGIETTQDKVWMFSLKELGASKSTGYSIYPEETGTSYTSVISLSSLTEVNGTDPGVWLRSAHPTAASPQEACRLHITKNQLAYSFNYYVAFGFCI